ncbi:MAG: M20/M25/M40 family metallo-hydrolase [Treponema sp.]|nr:M20/M25/M40 family metallo-hydrolase [Treponema sp.]
MIKLDEVKITKDMQDLIRCRTVSNRDESLVDRKEFSKLYTLLEERFPALYAVCRPEHVGKTGLVFRISGNDAQQLPHGVQAEKKNSVCRCAVLMAHYDVVPVVEKEWKKPPFDAVIEDGVMWGRGTLDTKGTFCAILESVNEELAAGWKPQNDMYLSFSGEEEIDGSSCTDIVSWFEKQGIHPDFVLDEGGAIVEKAFPGVQGRCAMIGVAEKGSVNINCTTESPGGHASAPPAHSAAGYIAMAAQALENHPYKTQLTRPVKEMIDVLAPGKKLLFKTAFRLFGRKIGGEVNAMMHTTCAVTRLAGSSAYNVLPHTASLGMNVRLLGTDTIDTMLSHMKKAVNRIERKNKIQLSFNVVNGMNPSIVSDTHCPQWDNLRGTILKTWPGVIVSPYLMMACSDSRHYCRITDKVYRFSAMYMSKEDRGLIHGNNERIALPTLFEAVRFYCNLLETL